MGARQKSTVPKSVKNILLNLPGGRYGGLSNNILWAYLLFSLYTHAFYKILQLLLVPHLQIIDRQRWAEVLLAEVWPVARHQWTNSVQFKIPRRGVRIWCGNSLWRFTLRSCDSNEDQRDHPHLRKRGAANQSRTLKNSNHWPQLSLSDGSSRNRLL